MAKWIIEDFTVKPSGFLAKSRGKRVLVDDDGEIYNEDIPGYPSMNLPCVGDYKNNYRTYRAGDEITRYCNIITFTQYIVFAQDCAPFAYVQRVNNSPDCGYLTPLPTPAVPPNPFGNATYGLYKFYNDCDIHKRPYRVDIKKRAWVGVATEIDDGSPSNVQITYGSEQDKFAPIRASECILTFLSETDYQHDDLITDDERMFRVDVYYTDNGDVRFSGFIKPDSASEPFAHAPYPIAIRATDGLGALQNISYPFPVGSKLDISQSIKDILCFCLAGTSLNLDIQTVSNLYEIKMPNGLNNDPLALSSVNPVRMADSKGQPLTCYDVLIEQCVRNGAYIVQSGGKWVFVRVNELSFEKARRRTYNYTGLFLYADYVDNKRVAGKGKEIEIIDMPTIETLPAYKRALVFVEFGDTPSYIYNGDFTLWDGANFNGWTRYGGIDISRIQRSVKTTQGTSILIEDYAMKFNAAAENGRYIEASPLDGQESDKIKLNLEIILDSLPPANFGELKLRVSVGTYSLYNENKSDKYEWVNQLATCTIDISKSEFIELNMPELPVSGDIIIQIYGANFFTSVGTRTGGRPDRNSPIQRRTVPAPYVAFSVDNVTVNLSREETGKFEGILHFSENYKSFYNSPDQINILYGDYSDIVSRSVGRPSRGSINSVPVNSDLYAIYTSDGSYSTLWYEYGQGGTPVPIGLNLAKSITKAYQKPYKTFSGDLMGENIDYLNVFEIDKLPGKLFAFQGVTLDLKFKTARGAYLAEIFSRPINTNTGSIPLTPGQGPPPITQNPNGPVNCVSDSVFQCPFDDTFGIDPNAPLESVELSYNASGSACAITPDTLYYASQQPDTGVELFTDLSGTIPAPDGYYSDGINSFLVSGGIITTVESCVIIPQTIYYIWAKLFQENVQVLSGQTYADIRVSIYSNSVMVEPSYIPANLFEWTGQLNITNVTKPNRFAPDYIAYFSNQNTNTKAGELIEDSTGTSYDRKIAGTANNTEAKYLGFITR